MALERIQSCSGLTDRHLGMTDKQRMNGWCNRLTYFNFLFLYSNSALVQILEQ